jgi:hypothetical protein
MKHDSALLSPKNAFEITKRGDNGSHWPGTLWVLCCLLEANSTGGASGTRISKHVQRNWTAEPMPTSPPAERSLRQLVERGERPFPSHPQVDRYFPAAAIEDARRRLCRALDRGDGPGLVIGAAGMGKTLLLQALAAQFHQKFDVVLLGCARICTRRALLQAILFELGLP